jgi:putative heme-binding domain-containing protein
MKCLVICRWLIAGLSLAASSSSPAAERVPWTTSRILGSPEPPSPYVVERVLHQGRIQNATELDFLPGSNWALILAQNGRLHGVDRAQGGEPRVLADLAVAVAREGEAYSLEFHPGFATNYLVYAALWASGVRPQEMRIVRFELQPGNPPTLDPATAKTIVSWPSNGHNGCDLHFGPDGMLYFSAGDSASPVPPDPHETGQRLDDFLSSILRIDVDRVEGDRPYAIPADNPFINTPGARPEIWAYGFRNPWKMSFDPRDGALWVGDVGWELWEMIFRIDHGGFNGGWSIVEGPHSVHPDWPRGPTPISPPVISMSHIEATSITGGLVYRGTKLPELRDAYIFGDWGMSRLWALWWRDGRMDRVQELAVTPHQIVGFAEDEAGELYYLDYRDGSVYELRPNPQSGDGTEFPRKLSETGLFTSVRDHALAPGVESFDIAAPMWHDHATAVRAAAFPGTSRARWKGDYFETPTNAVLLRTVSMEMTAGDPRTARRLETQLLHYDGLAQRAYTYRWNEAQTDAELVDKDGAEELLNIIDAHAPGGRREQRWRYHSRAECIRCHMVRVAELHGNLNAFEPHQLASATNGEGDNELARLITLGLIEHGERTERFAKLVNPHDEAAPIEQRARSYLHANCAHCHKPDAGGAVAMYWPINFETERLKAIDVNPARGDFGIVDAKIIYPSRPQNSSLYYRLLTTGSGRMPTIGSTEVDVRGTELVRDWISSPGRPADRIVYEDHTIHTTVGLLSRIIALKPDSEQSATTASRYIALSESPFARDLLERFLPPEQRRRTLGAGFAPQAVLALTGDVRRGRELFFSAAGPQCFSCHQIGSEGRHFGPPLTSLAAKYSRDQLLEHIVKPNLLVEDNWRAHIIETKDDESHTGFLEPADERLIRLRIATGDVVSLPREQISSTAIQSTSLMPEGLLDNLTAQEAADLLEFLLNLK